MRGVPGSGEPRPEAIASGTLKVARAAYADGYDQGRYGRRFVGGRVDWEPKPPRGVPDFLGEWWRGHREGRRARMEIDHAGMDWTTQGQAADGPRGPQGTSGVGCGEAGEEAGGGAQGGEPGPGGAGRRGGDAGPAGGVMGRRAGAHAQPTGLPHLDRVELDDATGRSA